MRRPWILSTCLAALVFAAACSASDDAASYEIADEIIASIDQPVTRVVSSDDCTRTVVVDEYGFETESAVCSLVPPPAEDDADPAADPGADMDVAPASGAGAAIDVDALLADDSVLPLDLLSNIVNDVPDAFRSPLAALSLLLDDLDVSCGTDPEAWTDGAQTAAAEMQLIAASLETSIADGDEDATYLGSSSSRLLARALLERALLLTGCAGGAAASLTPGAGPALRLNVATATLATAVEHLGRALRGTGADPLFFHTDELAHLRWMRSAPEPVEFVVVGTSQATHGISPIQLSEATGRVVGSVAIPGAVAEVQQHWLPTVMDTIDPKTIVWAVGPIDLVVGCVDDGREATYANGAARRAASFDRFGWLADLTSIDRILGPVENEVYLETPIGQGAAARYPTNRLGEAVRLGSISQVAIDEHRANFGPAFEHGEYCEDRAALMRSIVEGLRAEGRDVVFVGMPVSPDLVPFYPGGSAALAEVMGRFREEVAEPAGVPFVDLTGAIQEPRYWSDWVHPVAEGSAEYTAAIAASLTAEGVW